MSNTKLPYKTLKDAKKAPPMDDDPVLYDDGKLRINAYVLKSGLTLFWYYFPGVAKHIAWDEIEKWEVKKLELLKYKTWGMALSKYWWPMEMFRYMRNEYAVHFDLKGQRIGSALTPDDVDEVARILREFIPTDGHGMVLRVETPDLDSLKIKYKSDKDERAADGEKEKVALLSDDQLAVKEKEHVVG